MPQFFRFIAFFAFGAGILGGLGLIGSAQPESTYGDVNTIRVIYGVVVLLTGLIWAMTWWALAELVETVRSIAGAVGVGNPEPTKEENEGKEQKETRQQKPQKEKQAYEKRRQQEEEDDVSGATVAAIIFLVLVFAVIFVMALTSA